MTDKEQIIIDEVIVSDCKHFCLEAQIPQIPLAGYSSICCEENVAKECKDNPNCYFKQLALKTQEYEQLEEKYEALKLENEEGYEIVAELKQECEELEKKLNTSEEWRIKAESLNEKQDLENTRYRKECEEQENKIKKLRKNLALEIESNTHYRKALEEIESVIKILGNRIPLFEIKQIANDIKKILDIINKAKS